MDKTNPKENLSAVTQNALYAQQGSESADGIGQVGLKRLAIVLWGGKWTISIVTSLFIAAGIYYTFFIAVPLYSATTQLVLEVRGQPAMSFEDLASGASTEDEAINTELEIIASQGVLERLILEMDLQNDSEFNTILGSPPKYSIENLRLQISNLISPALSVEPSKEDTLNVTIDNLRSAITTFKSRSTYILNIRLTTEDGVKSARIANRLAEIYIEEQVFARLEATEYAVNWLSNRVMELGEEVQEKEKAVSEMQASTDVTSAQAPDTLNLRAKSLRDRLERAILDLNREKARLITAQELFDTKRVEDLTDELQDPTLRRLLQPFDSDSEKLFFQRAQAVLIDLQAEVTRQEAQVTGLEIALNDINEQFQEQSSESVELYRLTQDMESSRILYETFQSRLKETSIQLGLQQADSRILSQAKRSYKVSPRRSRTALFTAFLGLFFGIGVVLLRTFGAANFRTAEELETATGYRVLGQIPILKFGRRRKLLEFLKNNPTSPGVEALRDIRTSILMADVQNRPCVIMQTSSLPGEGKTTGAIGLSQSLAALNKRVLLVETDIRRMTLNEYFDGRTHFGNVVSVVSGEIGLADAVMQPKGTNFDVLLGGRYTGSAADFLSSKEFEFFLETARNAYDYVILDTPPVLIVSDARIIAHLADAVIYNVKWGSTHPRTVNEGLKKFSSLGIDVTGLLLTQVDMRKLKEYGYGNYGGYGSGYYGK